MTFEEWIRENLVIDSYDDAIDWGEGTFTPVVYFIEMFEDVAQKALDNNEDVRQAIYDNDNGRGFKDLILN